MSRPWWDTPRAPAALKDATPVLFPGARRREIDALQARIAGYVPEWRDLSDDDAGFALVRLFGLQLEPILARAERLPEKALTEFLSAAGVNLAPPRSARATVSFTPATRNSGPVQVPAGYRMLSGRSDGEKGDVSWETDAPLIVPNAQLSEINAFDGKTAVLAEPGTRFRPFGGRPALNAALYLGFSATAAGGSRLSLGFVPATDGAPAPVVAGGPPLPGLASAVLRWEALTDRGFVEIDVLEDTTATLGQTGIVTLEIPRAWRADRPGILGEGAHFHWLRLRLVSGAFPVSPRLSAIHTHVVGVTAKETQRDEFPVPEKDGAASLIRLSRTPVLPRSIVLEIDEGAAGGDIFAVPDDAVEGAQITGTFRRWSEVETLAGQRPDAQVFVLEAATGTIRFGDNREGRAPPPGIRNIAVRAYATTLGGAGNVASDEISRFANRLTGIEAVTNPAPASGGVVAEVPSAALLRGPAEIKARGRAVSTGDMASMATQAPGADILRAYALSGVDPALPGAVRPGTVGVFVIPRRHPAEPSDKPPLPTSETLNAVARYLAGEVGPLGARVSVAAPRFQEVRVEATIAVAASRDPAVVASAVRAAIDLWLSPETGDWQIGATLRHADLTHVVMNADRGVVAVPFLAMTLDGIASAACSDVSLVRFGLPWPVRHQLVVETQGATP